MQNAAARLIAMAAVAVAASACADDGVRVERPKLFDRYVAIGNSITAGYESDGINDSTQAHAYPVLLASRMGASLGLARLRKPGCPAPLTGAFVLTDARIGGSGALPCAGIDPLPAGPIQNLAFPGFRIADVLSVPGGALGLLYAQILPGSTIIEAMVEAKPSLVSIWLGNNDVLSAVTLGNAARLTPLGEFDASLAAIVAAIRRTSARDAILIGVVDPLAAPIVQPGAYLWLAAADPVLRAVPRKPVNANCAPLLPGGQRNALAENLISLRVASDATVAEISCADGAPYVLPPSEQQLISGRVAEFNVSLRRQAEAGGWVYLDPNEILRQRVGDPGQVRRCQSLSAASSGPELQAALVETCPHPSAPNFFGSLISYDAVHPSLQGQRLIAEAIETALRAKHPGDF